MKEGKGKYTWANGDYYEGEFKNDHYNGKGKYMWANGKYHVGKFQNWKREGKGKAYYLKNGNIDKIEEGNFVDDLEEGSFTIWRPYEGPYIVKFSKGKKIAL